MLRLLACFVLACVSASSLHATSSEWTETDGTHFKGEPAALFGSLALFRTGDAVLRRVPLRNLSDDDCRRFHQAIAAKPARAASWQHATGKATSELPGAVYRLEPQYRRMVPADLAGVPEPELIFLISGSHSDPASWEMVNNLIPTQQRIQRVYPGMVGTVFFGRAHTAAEQLRMATDTWAPWYTADYEKQSSMSVLDRRAPRDRPSMQVLTRDGDVVLAGRPESIAALRQFIDGFATLLWSANSANPRTWNDLSHYGRVVRPLEFANASTGPQLVGNPLKADGLRQRGIGRVVARLEIDAEGKVAAATLQPGSEVPEKLAGQLTDALIRTAVFLPAIDHGKPVAASYDYVLDVPPPIPRSPPTSPGWMAPSRARCRCRTGSCSKPFR